MLRKHSHLLILGALLIVLLAAAAALLQPQVATGSPNNAPVESAPQQGLVAAQYFWSFSSKFVCGLQNLPAQGQIGEPSVKPGNYATDINIHNYNYRDTKIWKKLIVLVGTRQTPQGPVPFAFREPQVAQPTPFISIGLGPDSATMDDCNAVWAMAVQADPTLIPGALTIGYLVIISPLDLDVNSVYTAEVPGTVGTTPTGISLDVLAVQGKRVYIPANTLP
jgi:hypothetical protein